LGSALSYKPKGEDDFDPKKLDDERERYHEINKELKIYQNNIKDIDILEENAYGAAKLHYMD
jgi:hypothetical protein